MAAPVLDVWEHPKGENDLSFEFPTIENPRIDVSHDFLWCLFDFCRYGGGSGGLNGNISKNQPNPSINMALANKFRYWVPRTLMCQ